MMSTELNKKVKKPERRDYTKDLRFVRKLKKSEILLLEIQQQFFIIYSSSFFLILGMIKKTVFVVY